MKSSEYGFYKWVQDLLEKGNQYEYVYQIEMMKKETKWFYYGYDPKKTMSQIVWTPNQRLGHIFLTEEGVEEFKHYFITPRKVSIIRIPTLDALLTF